MTVAEMRERMSQHEYMQWGVFHGRKAQRQQMAMARARG